MHRFQYCASQNWNCVQQTCSCALSGTLQTPHLGATIFWSLADFFVLFWGPISDSQVTKNYKNPTISWSIRITVFIIFSIISYPNFSLRYVSQDSRSSQNWKFFGLSKMQKSCVNLSSPLKKIKLCKINPFKSLFWGVTILLKSVLCKKNSVTFSQWCKHIAWRFNYTPQSAGKACRLQLVLNSKVFHKPSVHQWPFSQNPVRFFHTFLYSSHRVKVTMADQDVSAQCIQVDSGATWFTKITRLLGTPKPQTHKLSHDKPADGNLIFNFYF